MRNEAELRTVDSYQHQERQTVPTVTVRRELTPPDSYAPYGYEISVGATETRDYSEQSAASAAALPATRNGQAMIIDRKHIKAGTERISAYNVEGKNGPRLVFSYLRDKKGRMSKLYVYLADNMEVQVGPPQSLPNGGRRSP